MGESDIEKTTASEYARVFIATEGGGLIGSGAGIYTSSALTESSLAITGSTLSGDYIGGTIGQLVSYWYNNRNRYKNNRFGLTKDLTKMLLYDIPVTAATYSVIGQITYYMVENNYDNAAVIGTTALVGTVVWHLLNYAAYSVIKNRTDESFLFTTGRILNNFAKRIANRTRE